MLLPELRFPAFRDTGEWNSKQLGDVAALVTEKTGDKSYTLLSVTAGVGLVTQIEKFGKEIAGESYKNYYVIKKGDFAYNKSSTKQHPEGQIALLENIDQGAVPNSIFTCFRVDKKSVSPYFLKYPFASNIHGKWLRNFIAVGARANGALNVDAKDLLTLSIAFPSLQEQQKIADCLSSIDALISAQSQKVQDIKTHKNSLMQQLFPRKGKAVPSLRFPEFLDDGEWECEELSNSLKRVIDYRGKAPPKSESGVPLITAKNVRFGWLDMTNDEYIEEDKYEEWMSKGIPQAGDILFTTEAPLGNVALFPRAGKFALGQRILTLRSKTERCLPEFLFHSLLSPTMQKEIDFRSTGSTAKGIKSAVFVKLRFCYPRLQEQHRIADCLTTLDSLISAQSQKLENFKIHKKGLMQALFPFADEVSA